MGPDAATGRRITGTDLARAHSILGQPSSSKPRITTADLQPDDLLRRVAHKPYPVYLWGDGQAISGRYSIVAHSPIATLYSQKGRTVLQRDSHRLVLDADGIDLAAAMAASTPYPHDSDLPFMGGAIGYVSYEYALPYLGLVPADVAAPLPTFHFAFYDAAYIYDHRHQIGHIIGNFDLPGAQPNRPCDSATISDWRCSVDQSTYRKHLNRILNHIAAGDIYQANYTVRFEAQAAVDPVVAALNLQSKNPSPLGAYIGFPFGSIWSCSPELLLETDREGRLESRPIKGTRRRDDDPDRDAALKHELEQSTKDRAELLMIVDLIRNDLGRVANYGSVTVETLYGIRSFANVHHLEATILAQQREEINPGEALRMLLPGGSVTGAPKRRAVETLLGLEQTPRSIYTGAVGYFSRCGRSSFNLPIRTAYHDGRMLYIHSGGGIVADSDPDSEWQEMQTKIANMRSIFADTCNSS